MRLLHVLTDMDPKMGGVCQAVRTIIFGLNKLGVYNEVASLNDPEASFTKDDPFKINALGQAKGPWAYNGKLSEWLLENFARFDVVIVHGLWQYHGYAVRRAMRKFERQHTNQEASPKFFVMPHGMLDPYFQRAKERRLKAIRNVVYWKVIESDTVNSVDGLLFTCEEERQLAREPFTPYHPKRELVVGLGVEEPPSYVEAMRREFFETCPDVQKHPYLLFLSRIHEKKGVDLLIRAYAEVFKAGNVPRVPKLVIAGPGIDSSYGKAMQTLVRDLNLSDDVFFTGMLVKDAKWGAFYAADAFILPSHQENFGIAVVEALACGKPVLISNKVNIWREIQEGGGGTVADDSETGTAQLLHQWQSLSHEAKALMGRCARNVYDGKFGVDPAARRVLDAIKL